MPFFPINFLLSFFYPTSTPFAYPTGHFTPSKSLSCIYSPLPPSPPGITSSNRADRQPQINPWLIRSAPLFPPFPRIHPLMRSLTRSLAQFACLLRLHDICMYGVSKHTAVVVVKDIVGKLGGAISLVGLSDAYSPANNVCENEMLVCFLVCTVTVRLPHQEQSFFFLSYNPLIMQLRTIQSLGVARVFNKDNRCGD